MTAQPLPAGTAAPSLTHRQIVTILSGLLLGMFLAALDQTIIASSIRTIADDLQGLSQQAWATTAYLITSTISTPLYGKLSDIYGRKRFFLAAIVIFVIGSVACGFADSMTQLAIFRGVQGIGAGGLFSLALAIIGDIVPPRERAKYQGYFLAVFGTSSVLGPVIGGFFAGADTLLGVDGWRWVFLVNIPLGLLALVVVSRVLSVDHQRVDHRIDWLGAVLLAVTLVPLLLLAEQGRAWGWTSVGSIACMVVGVAGLVGFLLAERAAGDEALLPLRLFRNRTVAVGSILNTIVGMGMFGILAGLPLYLQIVRGATPTEAGLLLLPLTAGIMTGSIISGQVISRTGRYKVFPVVGAVLLTLGAFAFSRIGVDTPMWVTMTIMVVFGLGLGGNMQPLILAVQNAVDPREMGVATSSATFFRQVGGTLGTAVFLSILFSTAGDNIRRAFEAIIPTAPFQAALRDPEVLADPANKPVLDILQSGQTPGGGATGVLDDSSFINDLDDRLARPFLVGFSDSMDLVFLVGACILALAIVVVAFLPEVELRTSSGLDAARKQRQDEDEADAADRASAAAGAAGTPTP
jgi:EmrB/QacA subfamily drug resistance transporter